MQHLYIHIIPNNEMIAQKTCTIFLPFNLQNPINPSGFIIKYYWMHVETQFSFYYNIHNTKGRKPLENR